MRMAWAWGAIAVAVGLGAGCGDDGRGHPPEIDAGVDAGGDGGAEMDAGRDAGRDAGHDAGVDAGADGGGAVDAGADGGAELDAGGDAGPGDAGPPDGGGDAGPVCTDVTTTVATPRDGREGAVTVTDRGYLVAWRDDAAGPHAFVRAVDASGGTTSAPVSVDPASPGEIAARLAWSGAVAGVAWQGTGASNEIWLARFGADGAAIGMPTRVTTGARLSPLVVTIATDGAGFGLAWEDKRDGSGAFPPTEAYAARVGGDGIEIGDERRLTVTPADYELAPVIVWTGAEWAIVFVSERAGVGNLWLARMGTDGVEIGDEVAIEPTHTYGPPPAAAWSGTALGVAYEKGDLVTREEHVYFFHVDATGGAHSTTVDLTAAGDATTAPDVAASGTSFGVVYSSRAHGSAVFVELDAAGRALGPERALPGNGPAVIWDGSAYVVVTTDRTHVFWSRLCP